MTEPFESLALTQSGSTLSGQVKYPAANTAPFIIKCERSYYF